MAATSMDVVDLLEDENLNFRRESRDFSEGNGGETSPASSVNRAGQDPVGISLDEVATKLLKDKYFLTALELHTELVERNGRELPRLRDFFSNPGNFERQVDSSRCDASPGLPRTASIQTFDSLDFARYSDDGDRQADERVAVLEFELRKAQETIKSLRANLTEAAESEVMTPDSHFEYTADDDSIKPHERRALNFLVNEYLLRHNYKLTSITFSDENDEQDFEDWDDVGLNIPKPPALLHLYRESGGRHSYCLNLVSIDKSVQVDMTSGGRVTKDAATDPVTHYQDRSSVDDSSPIFDGYLGADPSDLSWDGHVDHAGICHVEVTCPTPKNVSPAGGSFVCSVCKERLDSSTVVVPETPITPFRRADIVEERVTNGDEDEDDDYCEATVDVSSADDGSSKNLACSPYEIHLESCTERVHLDSEIGVPCLSSARSVMIFEEGSKRNVPAVFHETLVGLCRTRKEPLDNRLADEVSVVVDSSEKVVLTLARCLPFIVPNVILAKREELIPVILCTISLHPSSVERDRLLNILFNLIKRPDVDQRLTILNGFVAIAKQLGSTRVESELLPQCWEQINHKYVERRLLVSEACGVLIPFIPSEIRSSLVWSMLQQMLTDDNSDLVRESAVKSLSLLVASMEDTDKYSQGLQLLVLAIDDQSERVVNASLQILLPSYASWSKDVNRLETDLVPALIEATAKQISAFPEIRSNSGVSRQERETVINLLTALVNVLPWLFVSQSESIPAVFPEEQDSPDGRVDVGRFPPRLSPLCDVNLIVVGCETRVASLVARYDNYVGAEWYETWAAHDWLIKTMLPKLVDLSYNLELSCQAIIHSLAQFFYWLSRVFGHKFSASKVRPVFQDKLRISGDEMDTHLGMNLALSSIVPVYAAGVLAAFNQNDDRKLLESFLHELIVMVSLCHLPLDGVQATIVELRSSASNHDVVLSVLWDVVVHTSALVRCSAAKLFLPLIGTVGDKLLSTRVAPALVTLASDPEISVRISTVATFGAILQSPVQKDLLDKAQMQLQTFLDDPLYKDQHSLHAEIIRTFGIIASNADPKFRDEFVLPHLVALASHNNRRTNETKRTELALALFEAFSAVSCCLLSDQLIVELLLPGLKCLLTDVQQLLPQNEVVVVGMIHEFESKVDCVWTHDRIGSVSGPSSMSGSASSGIEDVRNRMTKMFSNRTPVKANIQTIFQLRKK